MTTVNARFPWVLFLPLASITEIGGIVLLLTGRGIGWAAIAAPLVGFLAMRGPVRPRFEFSDDGVIFRRSGKSPLLPWDEIDDVALVKASGRTVLAYRLKPGVTVMKRHPGAGFLRAKGLDFDGGYFVDQMTAPPEEILRVFKQRIGRP
ncbi:MAG TPA: hypothetical protein VHW91_05830 [Candidatus Dormibacteraeota bacterium]|jgi:hypothetical protein|nr:hypothetical protein [Candidatus Dormibacteraeota bacterium]